MLCVRSAGNIEVALDHDVGAELHQDIVAIEDQNEVIVAFLREFIQVAEDARYFGKVRGFDVVSALGIPAYEDRRWVVQNRGGV